MLDALVRLLRRKHGLFDQRSRWGTPARRRRKTRTPSSRNGSFMPAATTRIEATARDGQRECPLDLFARPHTARADDAFGRIVSEIRIGFIDTGIGVVAGCQTVPH